MTTYFFGKSTGKLKGLILAFACFLMMPSLLALPHSTMTPAQKKEKHKQTDARIWPATDYTRLTLETEKTIHYQKKMSDDSMLLLTLFLDPIDSTLTTSLKTLNARIQNDPHIEKITLTPGDAPSVWELKIHFKHPIFLETLSLKPILHYGHRLIFDFYPKTPLEPLLSLLETTEDPKPIKESKNTARNVLPPTSERMVPDTPEKKNPRALMIAIDAGHGGEDPGALGANGIKEKEVTLAISKTLAQSINRSNDGLMQAFLIRESDYFIPLHERVYKARRLKADLFISIHADAFENKEAKGSSVFALSRNGATSALARWLANRENASDLVGGVTLKAKDQSTLKTLLDLSQSATQQQSMKLAEHILSEVKTLQPLHKKNVEQAGFAVLKAPDIPSVLVETAFISNPEEALKLQNPAFQKELANAITSGIRRYIRGNPHYVHHTP